jgi:hypothetical protein
VVAMIAGIVVSQASFTSDLDVIPGIRAAFSASEASGRPNPRPVGLQPACLSHGLVAYVTCDTATAGLVHFSEGSDAELHVTHESLVFRCAPCFETSNTGYPSPDACDSP